MGFLYFLGFLIYKNVNNISFYLIKNTLTVFAEDCVS